MNARGKNERDDAPPRADGPPKGGRENDAAGQVDERYMTYVGRETITNAWVWSDVHHNDGQPPKRLLVWDFRPLESRAWGSFFVFAEKRIETVLEASKQGLPDPGDNVIEVGRWFWRDDAPKHMREPQPIYYPTGVEADRTLFRPDGVRRGYIPTRHYVNLLRRLFPRRRSEKPKDLFQEVDLIFNPCAPPWPSIETELLAAGSKPDELTRTTAPALLDLLDKARNARASVGGAGKPDGNGKKKPKSRMKTAEAQPLIEQYVTRHPDAAIRDVAESVGCSVGTVNKTLAWQEHLKRRNLITLKSRAPMAMELHHVTENGCTDGMKHIPDDKARDPSEEAEEREQELYRQIGEYARKHPGKSPEQIARGVGCKTVDVENHRRLVARLVKAQQTDASVDGGEHAPRRCFSSRPRRIRKPV